MSNDDARLEAELVRSARLEAETLLAPTHWAAQAELVRSAQLEAAAARSALAAAAAIMIRRPTLEADNVEFKQPPQQPPPRQPPQTYPKAKPMPVLHSKAASGWPTPPPTRQASSSGSSNEVWNEKRSIEWLEQRGLEREAKQQRRGQGQRDSMSVKGRYAT